MARMKRNRNNLFRNTDGYIKKYFGTDISKILVPSIKSIQNCDIPYVNHQEAESVLSEYLKGDRFIDKSIAFTGLKGSGKTTILRHVFGIEENSNKCKYSDDERTIIIPIDFNRAQVSAQIAILSSLRSAVRSMCKKFGIDEPNVDNEEFFKFVEEQREDLLNLDATQNLNTPHNEVLTTFLKLLPVAFASCQLQYVLESDKCNINLVLLIIDNVEGFRGEGDGKSKYLNPVIEALHLRDCISQRMQPTKWSFNVVIACRHYIVRLIRGEEDENGIEAPLISSFLTTVNTYDLQDPVKIKQIVDVRDQVFSRNHDSEKWKTSVSVVKKVLSKMEGTIGDFILQLELKDIRKSLDAMSTLIQHNGLQKKTEDEINNSPGSFQIDSPSQFDLSRINLIRTLAIGNRTLYSESGLIPNLMYNKKEEYLELYPLLTLKYFLEKGEYEEPAWDNACSITAFYQTMKDLFNVDDSFIERYFMEPVSYFLKHRILLRSADQEQDEVPGLTHSEILKIESVYVSGAAVSLWEELYNSSALFQLYLDDIFVDSNSDYLSSYGNDIEHCFEYLKYLRTREEMIFNRAANQSDEKIEEYIRCFGDESICEYLAHGLSSSLDYIANHDESQRGIKAERTKARIDQYVSTLGKWSARLGRR